MVSGLNYSVLTKGHCHIIIIIEKGKAFAIIGTILHYLAVKETMNNYLKNSKAKYCHGSCFLFQFLNKDIICNVLFSFEMGTETRPTISIELNFFSLPISAESWKRDGFKSID